MGNGKLQFFLFSFFFLIIVPAFAQLTKAVVSGPWVGNVEIRNAVVWVEVSSTVKTVAVKFKQLAGGQHKTVFFKGELGKDFNPVKIPLNGLQMNTVYRYSLLVDGKAQIFPYQLTFKTKDLWQWRKPAPDFSFLTGSCAYFNERVFDRPGVPYGSDSSIFTTMANTTADFNLWLGDNWYTREVDFYSSWGLNYRASHDRTSPPLQKLFASMPQYAIWDDHDFGPDNSGKSFILKDESRRIFMDYWCNPSYGENGQGIYSKLSWSDADIFLTDDRYFRSDNNYPDSINGKPDPGKSFFGRMQMDWLKNSLKYSKATFKIIAVGSQVLNPVTHKESLKLYSYEYNELLNYLKDEKITGVIFLTGDQHHSEIIRYPREGTYALYDITISPFTAGITRVRGEEVTNPFRVPGTLVEQHNFGKITVTGNRNERVLAVTMHGRKGEKLVEWKISEKELQ